MSVLKWLELCSHFIKVRMLKSQGLSPQTQDVNWTSYVRSIYVLCLFNLRPVSTRIQCNFQTVDFLYMTFNFGKNVYKSFCKENKPSSMDVHFSQFLANYQHPLKNEHPKRHLSKIHLTIKTYKEIFKDLQVFLGCSIQENL